LVDQPGVFYVEDDAVYDIVDIEMPSAVPEELELYGLNRRRERICASIIEKMWARTYHNLLDDHSSFRDEVYERLTELAGEATGPVIFFSASSEVAVALHSAMLLR